MQSFIHTLNKQIMISFFFAILASSLVIVTLSVTSIENSKTYACDFVERYEACPDTIDPVCSVYPGVCNSFTCLPQEYINSCNACIDPTVSAYSMGPCPTTTSEPEGEIMTEEEALLLEEEEDLDLEGNEWAEGLPIRDSFYVIVFCEEHRPTNCTLDYNPVCIVECLNGTCTKTARNACAACADPTVLSYSLERCEKEKISCDDADAFVFDVEACSSIYDPVCAYAPNCTGSKCATTVSNSCQACIINQAEYFTVGPC